MYLQTYIQLQPIFSKGFFSYMGKLYKIGQFPTFKAEFVYFFGQVEEQSENTSYGTLYNWLKC